MAVSALPWRARLATRRPARAIAWLSLWMLSGCSGLDPVDDRLFDLQVGVIRAWRGPAILGAEPEILIVGIDEATLDRAGVPIALVHGVLGRALDWRRGMRCSPFWVVTVLIGVMTLGFWTFASGDAWMAFCRWFASMPS